MSMDLFPPPEKPVSPLAIYRKLSPLAGVHVSPIILGAMSVGDKWNKVMGSMDKEQSFKLLDAYYDMGGNFIDTANMYQDETSEMFIGEWAEKRGIRDQLFIATKYTSPYKRGSPNIKQKVHYMGSSTKALHLSVVDSLKKLRTDYIDLLYVHWWDWECGVEEIMRSLHNLVASGKVLYLGVSDTPAWIVSKANEFAKWNGLTPFVIYQGLWNVMDRDFEREIIPMARAEGLALAPWNVLASGKFRTDAEEEARAQSGEKGRIGVGNDWKRNERERKVSQALEKIGKELGGASVTAVAIAYLLQRVPYVFPLVGGRKVEHLKDNIDALEISLNDRQLKELEKAADEGGNWTAGFPAAMIGNGETHHGLMATSINFAPPIFEHAIRPENPKYKAKD